MKALSVIVRTELAEQVSKVAFTEDDEVIEALRPDRLHESLCVGIAVWAACWDAHAVHALGSEPVPPSLGEQRITIVNELGRMRSKPSSAVEQVASDLLHPLAIGIDSDTSEVHAACPQFDDEEDHVANGTERAEGFDGEEVASVQGLPVARQRMLPGSLARPFWGRLDTRLGEHAGHRRASDVNLQAAKGISDLGVAPRDVLAGETDDEGADLVGLARSAGLAALLRAVVLLRDELISVS